VVALDIGKGGIGEVLTWGKNETGQLGHGGYADKGVPTKVQGLLGLSIVKIYAQENMSFAVDKFGMVYCWGSNKSNIMILKDAQLTKVDVPTPMVYPDFFAPSPNVRVTPTNDSLALYSSKRLVKSQASET
jgi:alpha-tubulin suppressor-like RCC1 family protein